MQQLFKQHVTWEGGWPGPRAISPAESSEGRKAWNSPIRVWIEGCRPGTGAPSAHVSPLQGLNSVPANKAPALFPGLSAFAGFCRPFGLEFRARQQGARPIPGLADDAGRSGQDDAFERLKADRQAAVEWDRVGEQREALPVDRQADASGGLADRGGEAVDERDAHGLRGDRLANVETLGLPGPGEDVVAQDGESKAIAKGSGELNGHCVVLDGGCVRARACSSASSRAKPALTSAFNACMASSRWSGARFAAPRSARGGRYARRSSAASSACGPERRRTPARPA